MTPDVDPAQAEARRRVAEEAARFREALPSFLDDAALRGRWVVFKDGAVHASFDDEDEALADAIRSFGRFGGFIVARVEPHRVYRVGAAGFRPGRP